MNNFREHQKWCSFLFALIYKIDNLISIIGILFLFKTCKYDIIVFVKEVKHMKSIAFLVEDDFHKDFKVACAINGRQIKERIMEIMQKDIEELKKEQKEKE